MNNLTAIVRIEVRNRQGRLITLREFESKSFVANFAIILCSGFQNNAGITATNTSNVTYTPGYASGYFPISNPQTGDTGSGIIFGIGTNAAAPTDYKLQTLIANGSGAGQLAYQLMTFPQGVTVVGNVTSFVIQRLATNNSAGTINITEMGLLAGYGTHGSASNVTLLIHDVFAAVPILSTHIVTASYTIQVTT